MSIGIDTVITGAAGGGGGSSAVSEGGAVAFAGDTTKAVVFSETYGSAPTVIPHARLGDTVPGVNSVTALGCNITTPISYTGTIDYTVEGT